MGKSLVVVESPAKAKTINKYLGSGYKVIASKGHVRDLPQKGLGVDVENDFQPEYEISKDRTGIIKELKAAAKGTENVYLATDLDREGEAIAWHIAEALKLDPERTYRVVFNEITSSAIKTAFAAPGRLDMNKVNAQQARRILDRLVGYKISPLLWKKVRKGLSAGRVQSVTVRLVVEREREIEAFKPEEYWRIRATLAPAGATDEASRFVAELIKYDQQKFRPAQGEEALKIADDLRKAAWVVADRQTKQRQDKAPPPFITSELQRAASTFLGFSSRRTMSVAQALYEGVELGSQGQTALITYMRTDSHHIAQSALQNCREHIAQAFGPEYVPAEPHYFSSAKGAQEAHEAIRPTDVKLTPESVAQYLDDDQRKLYSLIWKRFVASQMKPAIWNVTTLQVTAGRGELRATGRTLLYDGHTRVTGLRLAADEQMVPDVQAGGALDLIKLDPSQHFTEPPPRYNEASLITKLESLGIGRPSTYASILGTIEDREYVEQRERRYWATDLGKLVTDKLVAMFPHILNVDFTRQMEEDLDKIETGGMDYVSVLREFYGPFSEALETAGRPLEIATDIACDLCGKKMVVRGSKRGPFLSCRGYPKCKNAKEPSPELVEKFKTLIEENPSLAPMMPKEVDRKCPQCGGAMVERMGRFGLFVGCKNYPECKFIEKAPPKGEVTELPCFKCHKPLVRVKSRRGVVYYACSDHQLCRAMFSADANQTPLAEPVCTECGKPMLLRLSRGEPFLGCSGYPECKTTTSLGPKRTGGKGGARRGGPRQKATMLKTEIACDKCGKMMVVRMSKRGPFLACPGYPKCKNAKDATPELVEQFNALAVAAEAAPAEETKESEAKTDFDLAFGTKEAAKEPKAKPPARKRVAGGKGGARPKVAKLETEIACDKCGKMMVVRMGPRGPFLACPGYPKCKNAKSASPEQVEQFNALTATAEAAKAADAKEPEET